MPGTTAGAMAASPNGPRRPCACLPRSWPGQSRAGPTGGAPLSSGWSASPRPGSGPPKARPPSSTLTYVPNNNSDSGAIVRTAKFIQPTLIAEPPTVEYAWEVPPGDEPLAQTIAEASRHIRALGWGIDLAIGQGSVAARRPSDREGLDTLLPRPPGLGGGIPLRVPVAGSLRSLEEAYENSLRRISPDGKTIYDQPCPPVCDVRAYATSGARPFCVFALRTPDEEQGFVALRPQLIAPLVGMIRNLANLPRVIESAGRDVVDREILGHPKDGSVERVSILPLPTIRNGPADGLIRRVLLAQPSGCDGALCRLLAKHLDGRGLAPLDTEERFPAITLAMLDLRKRDGLLSYYTGAARTWTSVTPVLLPGYDDRKQHRGDHQKRLARAEQLVSKALAQAGVEAAARIEITRVPWWPGTLHVRDYQPREKLRHYPRYHVRLTFDRPVTGPLAIGAGRHAGFGVFASCDE